MAAPHFLIIRNDHDQRCLQMHTAPHPAEFPVGFVYIPPEPSLSHGRAFPKAADQALHYELRAVGTALPIQAVRQDVAGEIIHLHVAEVVPVGKLLTFLRYEFCTEI